ncbi:hypothetical protein N9B94_01925 [Verrucomicrobia bacterium]|nr:hypothetical protein [Verrucomicrobiota bacterium]
MKYKEIESETELRELLAGPDVIRRIAFQNLNFEKIENLASQKTYVDCIFLGCAIPESLYSKGVRECVVIPLIDVPFNTSVNSLYTKEILFGEYQLGDPSSYEKTLDKVIYNHYLKKGKEAGCIKETLARRLHDHSITDALHGFLEDYDPKKVVAIMGGHSLLRDDKNFIEVARLSKELTELGYFMISGGGPGAMEATHVGAWLAGKKDSDLEKVVSIIAEAPSYQDALWLEKAFVALELYPTSDSKSLGIPTWLYGHEPPTPFATHIAKYFANSVREDGLLAIAKGGVIFSPGSAGTIQEIFQDATQNHYLVYGFASPMIFLNRSYWSTERPVYPMLKKMANEGKYQNMILSSCDTKDEAIKEIQAFTSIP